MSNEKLGLTERPGVWGKQGRTMRETRRSISICLCLLVVSLGSTGCSRSSEIADLPSMLEPTPPRRIDALSPWYTICEDDLNLHVDYCGWDERRNQRVAYREIHTEAIEMIEHADGPIIFCFFLFDCLYADEDPPDEVAEKIAAALIEKKIAHPDQPIALVLDLIHKGWSTRRSPLVKRLRDVGVDVFYSERLSTHSATSFALYEKAGEFGQLLDQITFGLTAAAMDAIGAVPLPLGKFDRAPVTIGTLQNAAYLKANHRKVLVTVADGEYHALVTSWNPHDPSAFHENHALTVSGKPARYAYAVLRDDMKRAAELEGRYTAWSQQSKPVRHRYFDERFPAMPATAIAADTQADTRDMARVCFATEQRIEALILEMLLDVQPGDAVRIQMFYLSRPAVLNEIIAAGKRSGRPVRLLLDPNRTGINYAKDGTPNAQAAAYLMQLAHEEGVEIRIRWYDTHGEQNHAKAMTITNPRTGKFNMALGSANWTRKNLGDINLEADLFVRNSPKVTKRFNALFDRFWFNRGGLRFSAAYDDPDLGYFHHAGMYRWAQPSILHYDKNHRPAMIEQELVHW